MVCIEESGYFDSILQYAKMLGLTVDENNRVISKDILSIYIKSDVVEVYVCGLYFNSYNSKYMMKHIAMLLYGISQKPNILDSYTAFELLAFQLGCDRIFNMGLTKWFLKSYNLDLKFYPERNCNAISFFEPHREKDYINHDLCLHRFYTEDLDEFIYIDLLKSVMTCKKLIFEQNV